MRDMGGPQSLALKLGLANPSFISHLAGPNPTRTVTEKAARKIEGDLGLEPLWLDVDNQTRVTYKSESDNKVVSIKSSDVKTQHHESTVSDNNIDTVRLTECIEKVISKRGNLSSAQLSKIITTAYNSNNTGDILERLIDSIIELMGLL